MLQYHSVNQTLQRQDRCIIIEAEQKTGGSAWKFVPYNIFWQLSEKKI